MLVYQDLLLTYQNWYIVPSILDLKVLMKSITHPGFQSTPLLLYQFPGGRSKLHVFFQGDSTKHIIKVGSKIEVAEVILTNMKLQRL